MADDTDVKARGQRCPICRKPTDVPWRPFCSKRCADVDLGRWLGGRYAIPGDPVSPEADRDEDEPN